VIGVGGRDRVVIHEGGKKESRTREKEMLFEVSGLRSKKGSPRERNNNTEEEEKKI